LLTAHTTDLQAVASMQQFLHDASYNSQPTQTTLGTHLIKCTALQTAGNSNIKDYCCRCFCLW